MQITMSDEKALEYYIREVNRAEIGLFYLSGHSDEEALNKIMDAVSRIETNLESVKICCKNIRRKNGS